VRIGRACVFYTLINVYDTANTLVLIELDYNVLWRVKLRTLTTVVWAASDFLLRDSSVLRIVRARPRTPNNNNDDWFGALCSYFTPLAHERDAEPTDELEKSVALGFWREHTMSPENRWRWRNWFSHYWRSIICLGKKFFFFHFLSHRVTNHVMTTLARWNDDFRLTFIVYSFCNRPIKLDLFELVTYELFTINYHDYPV